MLPLDDPRWRELDHRNWSHGKPSARVPDAPFVPDELAKLLNNPADLERFNDLWPWLCSEGTSWPAAYAAVPYAVDLARRLPPDKRFEYLYFVGLVAICSGPEQAESHSAGSLIATGWIKPYLIAGYRQALAAALPLLGETLAVHHGTDETRYLLAAAAALKGHCKLGEVLNHMDCICGECPKCGEQVYPDELQAALG
jgi:hypothetical protein